VFILEAKLQNDQKHPKWNGRAQMGQFVGFSDKHSSLVANVRHLSTNFISPQFHVVFDDLFNTVNRMGVDEPVIESICQDCFNLIGNFMQKKNSMKLVILFTSHPPLHEVLLDEAGQQQGNEDCIQQCCKNNDLMRDRNCAVQQAAPTPVTTVKSAADDPDMLPISDDDSVDSSLYS
jgi:hypothetical protein